MFIATQRMRVPYFREALDANYKSFINELLADYERKERELGFSPGPMRVRSMGPFDEESDEGALFHQREPSENRGLFRKQSTAL